LQEHFQTIGDAGGRAGRETFSAVSRLKHEAAAGRGLTEDDQKHRSTVAVLGASLASKFLGGADPVGKEIISLCGELTPGRVRSAFGLPQPSEIPAEKLPGRPPNMCPGCPHRDSASVLIDVKKRFLDPRYMKQHHRRGPVDLVFHGDTGCYTMFMFEPTKDLMHNYSGMGLGGGTGAGIDPKTKPTTGQDAELPAIQRILGGQQYMTVYKAIKPEAGDTAMLAVALAKGQSAPASLTLAKINNGTNQVNALILTPVAVTAANIKSTVVADGFWTAKDICTGAYAAACTSAGIQ